MLRSLEEWSQYCPIGGKSLWCQAMPLLFHCWWSSVGWQGSTSIPQTWHESSLVCPFSLSLHHYSGWALLSLPQKCGAVWAGWQCLSSFSPAGCFSLFVTQCYWDLSIYCGGKKVILAFLLNNVIVLGGSLSPVVNTQTCFMTWKKFAHSIFSVFFGVSWRFCVFECFYIFAICPVPWLSPVLLLVDPFDAMHTNFSQVFSLWRCVFNGFFKCSSGLLCVLFPYQLFLWLSVIKLLCF